MYSKVMCLFVCRYKNEVYCIFGVNTEGYTTVIGGKPERIPGYTETTKYTLIREIFEETAGYKLNNKALNNCIEVLFDKVVMYIVMFEYLDIKEFIKNHAENIDKLSNEEIDIQLKLPYTEMLYLIPIKLSDMKELLKAEKCNVTDLVLSNIQIPLDIVNILTVYKRNLKYYPVFEDYMIELLNSVTEFIK